MIMLGDGIKNKGSERALEVSDIAELLDGTSNGKPA
jgi:hypothetical protein